MLECLQSHGFVVNFAKSSLVPSQRIEHLGLLIDTRTGSFSLSQDHQQKLLAALETALQAPVQDVNFLAKLLGLLVSLSPGPGSTPDTFKGCSCPFATKSNITFTGQ